MPCEIMSVRPQSAKLLRLRLLVPADCPLAKITLLSWGCTALCVPPRHPYMMEQVKPQHSFSSVRPVLVANGDEEEEDACWTLDANRWLDTGSEMEIQDIHTARVR